MRRRLFAPVRAIEAALGFDFQICLAQTRLDEGIKGSLQKSLAGTSLDGGCADSVSVWLARPVFRLPDRNRMRCYKGKHFDLLW
jgi:hypothetical protein